MDGAKDHSAADGWIRGQVIAGRYRLQRILAEGGMGTLWLGHHLGLDELVVLKRTRGRSESSMLRSEARTLAKFRHPGVVQVLDVDSTELGEWFVVMEYLEGRDLDQLVRDHGTLATATSLNVLRAVAETLDAMHARGLVHRDIKPANVLLCEDGRVKLIDFGLAFEPKNVSSENESWSVRGTPEYMAPEQAIGLGSGVGPASDRYALAALALELFTGERTYESMSLGRLLLALLEKQPRKPSECGWPNELLDPIFERALSRDPSARYSTASDFVEALSSALGTVETEARPSAHPTSATISVRSPFQFAA